MLKHPFQIIVLAAGKGTRMNSKKSKLLHTILGVPIIGRVVHTGLQAGASRVVVITGHQGEEIQHYLRERFGDRVVFAEQKELRGTGHAVWSARQYLTQDAPPYTLVVSGDVPNLTKESIHDFIRANFASDAKFALMTATLPQPYGYGRVIRDKQTNLVLKIVEEKDATDEERKVTEINTGTYFGPTQFYHDVLEVYCSTPPNNAQNEWYLPVVVDKAASDPNIGLSGWEIKNLHEIQGVNTRADLAKATDFARHRHNHSLMLAGVTLIDPTTTYIDEDVVFGQDIEIAPNVVIRGSSKIDDDVTIELGCVLTNATIHARAHIKPHTVITDATIGTDTAIGPFAHLRPQANIGDQCKVGNFVEIKKTTMHRGAKASHLTYLGDTEVGAETNIGAGTITCNYDGVHKHKTTIGERAFIGSNTALVAPVSVGDGAIVGAGSVITRDVEPDALALERSPQVNKAGWAAQKRHEK